MICPPKDFHDSYVSHATTKKNNELAMEASYKTMYNIVRLVAPLHVLGTFTGMLQAEILVHNIERETPC